MSCGRRVRRTCRCVRPVLFVGKRQRSRYDPLRDRAPAFTLNARSDPAADAALHATNGTVRAEQLDFRRVVGERRADFFTFQLIMGVAPVCKRRAKGLKGTGQSFRSATKRQRMPSRRQPKDAPFDDGYAVARIVVAIAAADVSALAGPGGTHRGESTA